MILPLKVFLTAQRRRDGACGGDGDREQENKNDEEQVTEAVQVR